MKKIILLCVSLTLAILCLASCKPDTPEAHTHSFGEWETRKPATCNTDGERSRYCSCGEKQSEVIYATGEHIEIVIPGVAPTCTESGLTEGIKCKNCEKILLEQEIIPARHSEVIDEAVPATCTESGLTEGKHCSVCKRVLLNQNEIPKLAHSYTDEYDESCNGCGFIRDSDCTHTDIAVIPAVAPTCTKSGLTEGSMCAGCEEILLEQEIIPARHSEVIDEAVPATCTESGFTEGRHCSACGKVMLEQQTIDPIGHLLSDGRCENCDYTYSLGLEYVSNGDGTCYVSKIGSCTDTRVVIPEFSPDGHRVTAIGISAFAVCEGLASVVIPDSISTIGDFAFYMSSDLTSIVIPDSVTSFGEQAFRECTALTDLRIPEGVTTIENSLFYECSSLKSIVIPDSVTTIGTFAFLGCTSLDSLIIPDSVTFIGRAAFYRCYGLTSVVIPDGVTTIEAETFAFCNQLTSVIISKNVTSIGKRAFASSGLTSVTIPDSVTSIGDGAFSWCTGLANVYYTGSEEQWAAIDILGDNDFLNKANITYNYVPEE